MQNTENKTIRNQFSKKEKVTKPNKKLENKKKYLILGAVAVLVLACITLCVVLLLPRYSLSINGAENTKDENVDGITKISAEIEVNCTMFNQNGYYGCVDFEIPGSYSSNREVSLGVDGEGELSESSDGKFILTGNYVNIKEVAIRNEEIKNPIEKTYKIKLSDNETGETKIEYSLKVKTVLSGESLSLINTETPSVNLIKSSLESIDTVTEACIVNENNDPNGKIGKQGSYFIKVVFKDSRLPAQNIVMDTTTGMSRAPRDICEMGADVGGTIEVYKDTDGANTRKSELDAMLGTFFDSGISEIIGKKSVIRVSSELKASEQEALLQNMKKVLTE